MKTTSIIAIIGGTTSGKSTMLATLDQLPKYGYYPIIVPEIATTIFSMGIKPADHKSYEIQELIIKTGLSIENHLQAIANSYTGPLKPVIFTDRGIPDSRAYCSEYEYGAILTNLGVYPSEIKTHYEATIYLPTLAKHQPDTFKNVFLSNPYRTERVENPDGTLDWDAIIDNAIKGDERVLQAWVGTNKMINVPNHDEFEVKKKSFFDIVLGILGIPIPIEQEYKFIVPKDFNINALDRMGIINDSVHITQYYLTETPMRNEISYPNNATSVVERMRIKNFGKYQKCIYTLKATVPESKFPYEIERVITDINDILPLLRYADSSKAPISKQRHYFIYQEQYFELDLFDKPIDEFGNNKLLELETPHEQFTLPDFIPHLIDVTHDPKYKNVNIAEWMQHKEMLANQRV